MARLVDKGVKLDRLVYLDTGEDDEGTSELAEVSSVWIGVDVIGICGSPASTSVASSRGRHVESG